MNNPANIKITYKVFFALLAASSILLEILTLIDRSQFNGANFFSFFTVLSNMFASVMLLASALAVHRGIHSKRLNRFRGAAALFMVLTGVVFAVLLSGLDARVLTAVPWDNTVLHYIMPIVMLIDWIVDPPRPTLTMRDALWWLMIPVAYVGYSLIRGPIVNWYPYPFLDPSNGGYGSILLACAAIAVFTLGAAWLLIKAQSLVKR